MRKGSIIALSFLGAIVIAIGSGMWGFYEGTNLEATTARDMAQYNLAMHALYQIRFSMVALGKSDLNMSRQESEFGLKEALINLGALSKKDTFVQCTDIDKQALAYAKDYVEARPDPADLGPNPYWQSGITFCESQQRYPKATVSYMTTGK
jgi:hypothetical protein